MTTQGGEALSRERLFALVCDEAMKDGVLEPSEKELLKRLAGFLKLSSDEARSALATAKGRFDQGELGTVRPLDPGTLYAKALAAVLEDGVVDDLEKKLLAGVRQLLGIDLAQHEKILVRVKAALGRPKDVALPPPVAQPPPVAEASPPEPPPAAPPKPARAKPLRPPVAPSSGAPVSRRQPWGAVAACSLLAAVVSMVGVISPTALPSETLRQRIVLNRKPSSITSSGDTALQAKLRLLFALTEVTPTFVGPLELRAGSTYHVGIDLFSMGPGKASAGTTFNIGASLVLLAYDAATETKIPVERVEGRGQRLSDEWSRFEFFELTPPTGGPFLLALAGATENASPNAELWITRYPSLGRRTAWVVVVLMLAVSFLVSVGLAFRPH